MGSEIGGVGGKRLLAVITLLGSLCLCGFAQDASTTPPPAQAPAAGVTGEVKGSVAVLERKSHIFPGIAHEGEPLTVGGKFKLAANESVALSTIFVAAVSAGYNQATDWPEGYGQGGEGYGKRFGSSMAREASTNIFGDFILASALHEDPRFYVKKDLSFGQALKYSIARVFVTRTDSGKPTMNVSGLVGPMGSEMLANTYFPPGDRSASDACIRYAYDLGWIAAGNMVKQYWPTLNKKLWTPKK